MRRTSGSSGRWRVSMRSGSGATPRSNHTGPACRSYTRSKGSGLSSVAGAIVGRAPAVVVDGDVPAGDDVAAAEADAGAVRDGDGLPATAEADGIGDRDGTPDVVGTGVDDAVGVGALPSRSVQVVPSQVQVSPTTSPATDVDPSSSPPKSTTWPVAPSYARAGSERGAGAPADGASTQPSAGLVETQSAPV